MRRLLVALVALVVVAPTASNAGIDTACPTAYQTSAIQGLVENARGVPLSGIKVEIYITNSDRVGESATTNGQGLYSICAGERSGMGHNTYDVRAKDVSPKPLYAAVDQPYTTYTSPTQPADFTPDTKLPMLYITSLTISPREISTAAGPKTVTWTVRSKAPASTTMKLTLGHVGQTLTMTTPTVENGGPANGGWNVWTHQDTLGSLSTEKLYSATAAGFESNVQTTQLAQSPYTVDNRKPLFGPMGQDAASCGPGATAPGFSPAAPAGTTNPRPITIMGVCDYWSSGARSGVDPFSVRAQICRDVAMTQGCSDIRPVLSVYSMIWWPDAPLALGDYYLRYTASDKAGNSATSTAQLLRISETGGQAPTITALSPGNLASGDARGIVVGSTLTSPSSMPVVGFRVSDADGQDDLSPGSLRVRIYHMNENNLVYDYDPTLPVNQSPDPITKKGGGSFDIFGGLFRATGMPMQLPTLPGRYIATASITDRGGNSVTVAWHWLLLAAV